MEYPLIAIERAQLVCCRGWSVGCALLRLSSPDVAGDVGPNRTPEVLLYRRREGEQSLRCDDDVKVELSGFSQHGVECEVVPRDACLAVNNERVVVVSGRLLVPILAHLSEERLHERGVSVGVAPSCRPRWMRFEGGMSVVQVASATI